MAEEDGKLGSRAQGRFGTVLSLLLWHRVVCVLVSVCVCDAVSLAVPWGHVAGKAWGDPLGKRVLALHGKCAVQCI